MGLQLPFRARLSYLHVLGRGVPCLAAMPIVPPVWAPALLLIVLGGDAVAATTIYAAGVLLAWFQAVAPVKTGVIEPRTLIARPLRHR